MSLSHEMHKLDQGHLSGWDSEPHITIPKPDAPPVPHAPKTVISAVRMKPAPVADLRSDVQVKPAPVVDLLATFGNDGGSPRQRPRPVAQDDSRDERARSP
eukprot:CAMPEP_0180397474 /NCGR_PEP_ID=MMETSP0989-20121125/36044_1 /TAXON_ID=697907 /ORGANISM="non described non described, Strain CCMP2293" /LENGTH=100 /DNA_ID=CAMNT_0022399911 /DNA_START=20 /DNA_END=318 /DNA_ORIENTATION=+